MPSENGSQRRKVIIDTDCGVDDAQAILLALSREEIDVIGITCVGGNTTHENVLVNVLRVLAVANRLDVPVFPGCKAPIIGNQKYGPPYHGDDGLGDCDPDHLPQVDVSLVQEEYASTAIIRLAKKHTGSVSLVCLAPLTNIAFAMKLDPDFSKNLHGIFIMGGNHAGEGNETAAAEFNFYHDPEAASIVLDNAQCEVTLVGWETCALPSSRISTEFAEQFYSQPTPQGIFVHNIHKNILKRMREQHGEKLNMVFCDEWAVAVFLEPSLVLESSNWVTRVELAGTLTRGQCVPDKRWYDRESCAEKSNMVRHVLTVNVDRAKELMMDMVRYDFSDK